MGARHKRLVNLNPSVDRLDAMSSKQNLTLPGANLVKLLSKSLNEQLVGTYVQVSAQRNFGMVALIEGLTSDHSLLMISTH